MLCFVQKNPEYFIKSCKLILCPCNYLILLKIRIPFHSTKKLCSLHSRGGGDQVPSAGHHVGGWVIFSPQNTVSTWY